MTLIQQLVNGPWDDERFLVVPPGGRVAASFDEKIIKVVAIDALVGEAIHRCPSTNARRLALSDASTAVYTGCHR